MADTGIAAGTATLGSNQGLADTPDFDSYPIRHHIQEAAPIPRGVRVLWNDGIESQYQVHWLRENAADPGTMHPVTREQALQLVDIPDDLAAVSAGVDGAGNLTVCWSSGDESRFHPGWLRAYSHATPDLFTLPDRVLWGAELADAIPRFDGMKALEDEDELGRWATSLHVHGFGILEGLPTTDDIIERVPELLGPIRTSNFGRIFDVISKPDADSNAYTAMALPLHSDLATREYKPGLQFLHCIENGANGGDSMLADGFRIARSLAETVPDLYVALTELPMHFINKARDADYRYDGPMIRLDAAGDCVEVRWSPWLRGPVSLSLEQTDLLYRAMRAAFIAAEDPAHKIQVRLKPGDLLGFDNRRVLHGRTGFDPTTGNRRLRGCYVEREELESRLRILARHRRAREAASTN